MARLVELDCKMVVVACNTATAAAIGFLREKYAGMPIVGMEPAVKPACLATRSGVVGVLATERSLDGELFRRTAARYGSGIEVLTYPGTGFVELVEGDREDTPEAEAADGTHRRRTGRDRRPVARRRPPRRAAFGPLRPARFGG